LYALPMHVTFLLSI